MSRAVPTKATALRTVLLACDDPARFVEITRELAADALAVAPADAAPTLDAGIAALVITASGSGASIRALDPELPVIALDCDAQPAWEFIGSAATPGALSAAVTRAARLRWLTLENRRLAAALEDLPDHALVGRSAAIAAARDSIAAVAGAEVDVALVGERGTGKTRVARMIHRIGARPGDPFVAIACAAIPDAVIDRELSALAHGGTVLLDDVDAMSDMLKDRVRALAARRGAGLRIIVARTDPVPADFETLIGKIPAQVRLPPLRERRDDVPLLFAHLLDAAAGRLRIAVPPIADATRRRLVEHDWPGNVRELADFADRVMLGPVGDKRTASPAASLPRRVDAFERDEICAALAASTGDAGAAMAALGLPRKTFYYKVQRHGIDVPSFRERRIPARPNAKKPDHR